ncbi:unnamed protein product, partial [Rotaria magnacalcarata]
SMKKLLFQSKLKPLSYEMKQGRN